MDATPILACGPSFGPEVFAIGLAWLATIPLALTNVILAVIKCTSDRRTIHFSILSAATVATFTALGVFTHGSESLLGPSIQVFTLLSVPIVIFSQFVALLFDPSKKEQAIVTK